MEDSVKGVMSLAIEVSDLPDKDIESSIKDAYKDVQNEKYKNMLIIAANTQVNDIKTLKRELVNIISNPNSSIYEKTANLVLVEESIKDATLRNTIKKEIEKGMSHRRKSYLKAQQDMGKNHLHILENVIKPIIALSDKVSKLNEKNSIASSVANTIFNRIKKLKEEISKVIKNNSKYFFDRSHINLLKSVLILNKDTLKMEYLDFLARVRICSDFLQ